MLTARDEVRGFTLVEIIVGLVVAAIIGTAVTVLAVRHEHLAFALEQIMESRRALREGADALGYDLRPLATAQGAIYDMGDTYVDFRLATGFAVACALDSSRTTLLLPARTPQRSNLTSWFIAPEAGDTVLLYAAQPNADSARWYARAVTSTPVSAGSCPPEFGAGVSSPAIGIRVATPVPPDAGVGTALRFFRRARYELYRAGDGGWYLGFLDCLATRATPCATVQPVSGSYAPSGLRFRFFDNAGAQTADPLHVARVEVALRANSAARLHLAGIPAGVFGDSVSFTIRPRQ